MWPRLMLGVQAGGIAPFPPDAVVWPRSAREVQAVVRYAARRGVPVVPFGAGSGVCGAAAAIRRGIAIDMKRMARVVAIDEENHEATFEAGILGEHLEDALVARGLTLGHFPSSITCSTLGGWLAARSAGQCSSRYGKIEDMVLGVQAVTGSGVLVETDRERLPDATQLFVGSEGTLGVITRARLRVWPAPEVRLMRGWRFRSVAPALEAMRRIMQLGLRPSVVRLYDSIDTALSGLSRAPHPARREGPGDHAHAESGPSAPSRWALRAGTAFPALANALLDRATRRAGALLIVGFEGPSARAAAEASVGGEAIAACGGRDLGEGPGLRWLAHRYRVSYQQSPIFAAGAFADTMEVAATWDRLAALHAAVRAAIARFAIVMAHFSHAYPEGCSIYFTFVGRAGAGGPERYDRLWTDALSAALDAGGTLSHHHGVGLLKAPFMSREHGEAMETLRAVKRTLDPKGVLNPGKLAL